MKNRLLGLALLGLLISVPFYGQKFHAGITAGLNVATLSETGNLYDNDALRTGFGGGLALRYTLSPSFGIQSGLIYEQKGFRRKTDLSSGEEKYSGTYNYLTVPLLAEGSFATIGNTKFYGITGFYAGFKTYAENALVLTSSEQTEVTKKEDVNNQDFGWIIGGGVQVPAGNHFIQLGFKYSLGLSEVAKIQPDDRNKSVLFAVTLFF